MLCLSLARVAVIYHVLTFHLSTALQTVNNQNRVFEVDYENDQFLKDGSPFRYVSGSLHYFRVRRAYWQDRLRKYRAAGLNAVTTYVEWSLHEPHPGQYDFSGENDLLHFVDLAQREGLLVILRPGPYICAERDFGGYPPWLLHENPYMGLRTSDPSHTKYIHSWLSVLLPKLQPYLYGNGGPIIMMQVENEYGSYWACDRGYTTWLRDVFRSYVGDKAVLFTTDGAGSSYLKCGPIPGVFVTVDFGPGGNVTEDFKPLRDIQPHGPLVNSEFYPGWMTHWGEPPASTATDKVVNSTRELLATNASFNFYIFHGGTNFGFSSGANAPFLPQITSYDFNAPISEDGNLTEKYYAIKSVISEFIPVPDLPVQLTEPVAYGTVRLEAKVSLFDSDLGIDYGTSRYPRTFEELGQYGGFVLYSTVLPPGYSGSYMDAQETHDRTIVYLNKTAVGVLSRTKKSYSLILGGGEGQHLRLLVENQGHINYGNFSDLKGLTKNVTLGGDILTDWEHTGYPLSNVSGVPDLASAEDRVRPPAFYSGSFDISPTEDVPQDTFVDMTGWGKGVLWVNGFNLGRYWPQEGPQVSLYLPGSLLLPHNQLLLLELDTQPADLLVNLVDRPVYNRHPLV